MQAVIEKYAALPFDYRSDCCRFVGECIAALTGCNPIADLDYRTERQAERILDKFGGLSAAVTHYLGQPMADVSPQTGDACLIPTNDGRAALAVVYKGRIVARVQNGLMDYPLARMTALWRVN